MSSSTLYPTGCALVAVLPFRARFCAHVSAKKTEVYNATLPSVFCLSLPPVLASNASHARHLQPMLTQLCGDEHGQDIVGHSSRPAQGILCTYSMKYENRSDEKLLPVVDHSGILTPGHSSLLAAAQTGWQLRGLASESRVLYNCTILIVVV